MASRFELATNQVKSKVEQIARSGNNFFEQLTGKRGGELERPAGGEQVNRPVPAQVQGQGAQMQVSGEPMLVMPQTQPEGARPQTPAEARATADRYHAGGLENYQPKEVSTQASGYGDAVGTPQPGENVKVKSAYQDPYSKSDLDEAVAVQSAMKHVPNLGNAQSQGSSNEVASTESVQQAQQPQQGMMDASFELSDTPDPTDRGGTRMVEDEIRERAASPKLVENDSISDGFKFQLMSDSVPAPIEKKQKTAAKRRFSFNTDGGRVWGKILGLVGLDPRDVGLGWREVEEMIETDPEPLNQLLRSALRDDSINVEEMTIEQIARVVNKGRVYVGMFKPPHNDMTDMQKRRLVILLNHERGIFLMPVMASLFKADYDGDDGMVSLLPRAWRPLRDPMEMLIGYEGAARLDVSFMPQFTKIGFETEENSREDLKKFVREVMLARFSKDVDYGSVVDAIMHLNDDFGNADMTAEDWRELFAAIAKVSAKAFPNQRQQANDYSARMLTDICTVYEYMGREVGIALVEDRSDVRITGLNRSDEFIVVMAQKWVDGELPNNFQAFRKLFHTFWGDVKGANAGFRFTSDVANMFKIDDRFQIGEDGTYFVDVTDKRQMKRFYKCMVQYVQAEKMAKEEKAAASFINTKRDLQRKIIEEVGYPDQLRDKETGEYRYNSVYEWVDAFYENYKFYAGLYDEASVRVNAKSVIFGRYKHSVPSINSSREKLTWKDIASAVIFVYGDTVLSHLCPRLLSETSDNGYLVDRLTNKEGKEFNETSGFSSMPAEMNFFMNKIRILKSYANMSVNRLKYVSRASKLCSKEIDNHITGYAKRFNKATYDKNGRRIRDDAREIDERMTDDEMMVLIGLDPKKPADKAKFKSEDYDVDMMGELFLLFAIIDEKKSTASTFSTEVYGSITTWRQNKNNDDGVKSEDRWDDTGVYKSHNATPTTDTVLGKVGHILSDLSTLLRQGKTVEVQSYAVVFNPDSKVSNDVAGEIAEKVGLSIRSRHDNDVDIMFENHHDKDDKHLFLGTQSFDPKSMEEFDKQGIPYSTELTFSDRDIARAWASFDRYHDSSISERHGFKRYDPDKDKKGMGATYLPLKNIRHQLLGFDGDETQAAFLVCDVKENTDEWYAVELARDNQIPVLNRQDFASDAEWVKAIENEAKRVEDGHIERLGDSDLNYWVNGCVDALVSMGYELMMSFGMTSPKEFLKTKYAQMMIKHADDLDILGGIRLSMVFDSAMQQVARYLEVANSIDVKLRPADYARAMNDYMFAKADLAASSQTWDGVTKEIDNANNGVFAQMLANGPDSDTGESGLPVSKRLRQPGTKDTRFTLYYEAYEFWADGCRYDGKRYESLVQVMEDLELPVDLKAAILCDVARYWTQDTSLQVFDVVYQLEVRSAGLLGPTPSAAMQCATDIDSAYSSWRKRGRGALVENIREARRVWGNKGDDILRRMISFLYNNPQLVCGIDGHTYAAGVISARSKVSDMKTKTGHSPAINIAYVSQSMQKIGRMINEFEQADNRVVGLTPLSKVTTFDIISILANANDKFWCYDDEGNIGYIDYASLTKGYESLWDMLEDNPRIAAALRLHEMGTQTDNDGTAYMGATMSTSGTINAVENKYSNGDPIGRTKYILRDYPQYGGLISLLISDREVDGGSVATTPRKDVYRAEALDDYISRLFYDQLSKNKSDEEAAKAILDTLGVTEENLKKHSLSDLELAFVEREMQSDALTASLQETGDAVSTMYLSIYDAVKSMMSSLRANIDISERGRSYESYANKDVPTVRVRGTNALGPYSKRTFEYEGVTYHNVWGAINSFCTNDTEMRKKFAEVTSKAEVEKLVEEARNDKAHFDSSWSAKTRRMRMREIIAHLYKNSDSFKKDLDATGSAPLHDGTRYNNYGKALMAAREGNPVPPYIGIDKTSIVSYFDTVQELNGAKTGVSTGVEGSETYEFTVWGSYLSRRDNYDDLRALVNDNKLTQDFNGKLTTTLKKTGVPVRLQVAQDKNGMFYIANYEEVFPDKDREVGVECPEGHVVQDRTTDSFNAPVSSYAAFAMGKRSKGAEEHNMKIRKGGIDELNSICKLRHRYAMRKNADGEWERIDFGREQDRLDGIYKDILNRTNGDEEAALLAARMALAVEMQKADAAIGYGGDARVANYMSLASYMIIIGDNGNLYLRSLEQLVAAIKGRLGISLFADNTSARIASVEQLLNDTSETAVGRSKIGNVRDALSCAYDPKGKKGGNSPIELTSSYRPRNQRLLERIVENLFPNREERLAANLFPSRGERYHLDERLRTSRNVSDLMDRCELSREYKVMKTTCAKYDDDVLAEEPGQGRYAVGGTNLLVIGTMQSEEYRGNLDEMLDTAERYGMSVLVAVENIDKIKEKYLRDAVPVSDYGDVLIPYFDIMLNGSEAKPYSGRVCSMFQTLHSQQTVVVEDPTNVYGTGDGQTIATTNFVRNKVKMAAGAVERAVDIEGLFSNVFLSQLYKDPRVSARYELVENEDEIRSIKLAYRNKELSKEVAIDYGVPETSTSRRFNKVKRWTDRAARRYFDRLDNGDSIGRPQNLKHSDIVGWAKCTMFDPVDGVENVVYAPIFPFGLRERSQGVFERYNVEELFMDTQRNVVTVKVIGETSLLGKFMKMFGCYGASSKTMIDGARTVDGDATLENGMDVDFYTGSASIGSRAVGTEKRLKTMTSLVEMSRQVGYNFGYLDGAFPGRPDLAERLQQEEIPRAEWEGILNEGVTFIDDDSMLDTWIRLECQKIYDAGGNPSDLLCSRYYPVGTDGRPTIFDPHIKWEYAATIEQSLVYEDMLLKFYNKLDPTLCPAGINDESLNHLFALKRAVEYPGQEYTDAPMAKDYDRGVLQMYVKFPLSDGRVIKQWANVYIGFSFLGPDFSGFSAPNVSGSPVPLDATNTLSLFQKSIDDRSRKYQLMWALSAKNMRYAMNSTSIDMEELLSNEDFGYDNEDDVEHVRKLCNDLARYSLMYDGRTSLKGAYDIMDEIARMVRKLGEDPRQFDQFWWSTIKLLGLERDSSTNPPWYE